MIPAVLLPAVLLTLALLLDTGATARPPQSYGSHINDSPDFLHYRNTSCVVLNEVQHDCCTVQKPIDYPFLFGCRYMHFFSATTEFTGVLFGADRNCTVDAFDTNSLLLFSPYAYGVGDALSDANVFQQQGLRSRGGIAKHTVLIDGQNTTVIEWSDIVVALTFQDKPKAVEYGTVQVWLFRNGTIGTVYHLTGNYFGGMASINYDGASGYSRNSPLAPLLNVSEAFLAVPMDMNGTSCARIPRYNISVWTNPPDVCLNPLRQVENFHGDYSDDVSALSLAATDDLQLYGKNFKHGYKPLKVCRGDALHFAAFNHKNGRTKHRGSKIAGAAGAVVFAGLIAFVIFALV